MDAAREFSERRLTIVDGELQAEMVRAVLEEHGIRCMVRRPALGEIQWGAVNVGMGGPREIVVDAGDLDLATEVLASSVDTSAGEAGALDAAEPMDPELSTARNRMRAVWVAAVVVLFGIPIAIGIVSGILATLDNLA